MAAPAHDPLAQHLAQLTLSFDPQNKGASPRAHLGRYLRSIGYRLPRGDVEELAFRWVARFPQLVVPARVVAMGAMGNHSAFWADVHAVRRAGP